MGFQATAGVGAALAVAGQQQADAAGAGPVRQSLQGRQQGRPGQFGAAELNRQLRLVEQGQLARLFMALQLQAAGCCPGLQCLPQAQGMVNGTRPSSSYAPPAKQRQGAAQRTAGALLQQVAQLGALHPQVIGVVEAGVDHQGHPVFHQQSIAT